MARSGLGKGLGALIGTPSVVASAESAESGEKVHQISLASIVPSALQPRKDFGREALQELIDSIRRHGIIQPLIVRLATASPSGGGQVGARFELIAGERRWRARKAPNRAKECIKLAWQALSPARCSRARILRAKRCRN